MQQISEKSWLTLRKLLILSITTQKSSHMQVASQQRSHSIIFLSLFILNAGFLFCISMIFLSRFTNGITFTSAILFTATAIFISLSLVSMVLFAMGLLHSSRKPDSTTDDQSSLRRIMTVGIFITVLNIVGYSTFISFNFLT